MAKLQDIAWASRVFDCHGQKRIGHNTKLHRVDGGWSLQYHSTRVAELVEFPSIGARRLTINTGGWFSVTTAQRIRHALQEVGLMLVTNDLPGRWRVMDRRGNAFTIRGNKLMLRHDGNEWQRIAA